MFSYLKGTIAAKELTGGPAELLVVDVGGVGYEIAMSPRTLMTIGQVGEEVTVYTSLTIRETEWTIFGFAHPHEKQIFTLLQTVTGIGPKLALALVGTLGPQQLAEAIVNEDQRMISQAPGVGAKVAQRIILELKSKADDWLMRQGHVEDPTKASTSATADEVRAILEGLGYTGTEINLALKKAREEAEVDGDVESLVRYSLKVLGSASLT